MTLTTFNARTYGLSIVIVALCGCNSNSADRTDSPPNTNQLPVISGQPPTRVVAGDNYAFTPTASDPDDDPLSFSITGEPGWASFDEQTGSLLGTPGDADVGIAGGIRISVSDGIGSASLVEFSIVVDAQGSEPPPPDPNPAGYVGFGSVTRGSGSCPTGSIDYHVTSLSGGSGQGTIRDAVSQDCRHIIFDVAGDISLGSLTISKSYLTIDGSSAPAPGITFVDVDNLVLEASGGRAVHDVIVNNIRAVGSGVTAESFNIWDLDGSSGAPIYNVIFDHLTMRDSGDGNMDIYGDVHDVTLSNNLMSDSITGHHFSESSSRRERITVYGNVYARINERQPRIRYNTTQVDFVNNVIYGWGWFEGGAAGLNIDAGNGSPSANIENNIFHYVAGMQGGPDNALRIEDFAGSWHFEGNSWPSGESEGDGASNSSRISMGGFEVERKPANQIDVSRAGTHFPTAEEQSLLAEVSVAVTMGQ